MNAIESPRHDPKRDQSPGIAHTAGVFFFVSNGSRYTHFVWHLFVLLGAACHFLAVFSRAS
jgi:hemolysin III